jgi:hypothetical protein
VPSKASVVSVSLDGLRAIELNKERRSKVRSSSAIGSLVAATLVTAAAGLGTGAEAQVSNQPSVGSVVFNEFNSVNNSNGADYFELLVLGDGVDLRGLRVSDNELIIDDSNADRAFVEGADAAQTAEVLEAADSNPGRPGSPTELNSGESVFVLENKAYLQSVPKGTVITVWTTPAGVTTDTTVDQSVGDWTLVLAPGTGVTVTGDGLGGPVKTELRTSGDALYLYLPGADGDSAGSDNIYLDFVSWDRDGAEPPIGLVDVNLPASADAAYLIGSGCSPTANDSVANWVSHSRPPGEAPSTPGSANAGQDLAACRGDTVEVPLVAKPVAMAAGGVLVMSLLGLAGLSGARRLSRGGARPGANEAQSLPAHKH